MQKAPEIDFRSAKSPIKETEIGALCTEKIEAQGRYISADIFREATEHFRGDGKKSISGRRTYSICAFLFPHSGKNSSQPCVRIKNAPEKYRAQNLDFQNVSTRGNLSEGFAGISAV